MMTILEMFEQSALLTLIGMAVVFGFLWLMIFCINAAAKLIHKLGLDKDIQPSSAVKPPKPKSPAETPPEVIAAISAALTEYRRKEEKL
ncbi:MAG: OadG family protein [Spirochaetaceae bacterium]|jgi:oxaloacetate decarboxylase gamma subunit|nr:OadG family protein [Spirochaetaceae bacterium]